MKRKTPSLEKSVNNRKGGRKRILPVFRRAVNEVVVVHGDVDAIV